MDSVPASPESSPGLSRTYGATYTGHTPPRPQPAHPLLGQIPAPSGDLLIKDSAAGDMHHLSRAPAAPDA